MQKSIDVVGFIFLCTVGFVVVAGFYLSAVVLLRRKLFHSRRSDRLDILFDRVNDAIFPVADACMRIIGGPLRIGASLLVVAGLALWLFPALEKNYDFTTGIPVLWATLALRSIVEKVRILSDHWTQALRKGLLLCAFVVGMAPTLAIASVLVSATWVRVFPQEEEAAIKWDDCRKVRYLDSRPARDFLKTYSCSYERSPNDGHIVGGQCVYVIEPMIGTGCEEARVYNVKERPLQRP